MNLLILAALTLSAPLTAFGQSVCSEDKTSKDALLTICEHSRGMAPRPQPRLYLRVLTDGRAQYERSDPRRPATLELKEIFINGTEVQELARFGIDDEFQSARDVYPAVHRGIDSATMTTITFRGPDGTKVITLHNYAPSAPDNYEHYPDPLNRMMYLAEEVRLRAFGMKRSVPAITYCELLNNSRQYLGKRVSVYADLDYTMGRPWLTDECTTRGAALPPRIGVDYNELGKKYGSISGVIDRARLKPFYGRARLLATGRLNDDGTGDDRYTFEIDEYLDFQQLILPYQGTLKAGWTYSDTFRQSSKQLDDDAGITLSSPLKPILHHATRIEWTNLADFAARLNRPGLTGITFHVVSTTSKQVEKYGWRTTYTCEIVGVSDER